MHLAKLAIGLLTLTLSSSCVPPGTQGKDTDTRYSWTETYNCLVGCDLETPLATGAVVTVGLDYTNSNEEPKQVASLEKIGGTGELVFVSSSPPEGARRDRSKFAVQAVRSGDLDLQLKLDDGSNYDRIFVTVADINALKFVEELPTEPSKVGDSLLLSVIAVDVQERELVAGEMFTWSILSGSEVALVRGFVQPETEPWRHSVAILEALAPGMVRVEVRTDTGHAMEFEVTVE